MVRKHFILGGFSERFVNGRCGDSIVSRLIYWFRNISLAPIAIKTSIAPLFVIRVSLHNSGCPGTQWFGKLTLNRSIASASWFLWLPAAATFSSLVLLFSAMFYHSKDVHMCIKTHTHDTFSIIYFKIFLNIFNYFKCNKGREFECTKSHKLRKTNEWKSD